VLAWPSAENDPVSGSEMPMVTVLPLSLAVLVMPVVPPHAATVTADAAVAAVSAKNLARWRLILFLLP
jgi:hypothetical protein